MKLVSSNDPKFAMDTVQEAFKIYKDTSDASAAMDVLTNIKGVGPATASALLAVHDPENVIFFADEAFHWLCGGGKEGPIKYNAKEYKELNQRAQALARRLKVKAVDIEKVAFVIMRPQDGWPSAASGGNTKQQNTQKGIARDAQGQPAKRETSSGETEIPARRSKRGKHA